MDNTFITEVRAYAYTVVSSEGPTKDMGVGRLYIKENRRAARRGELQDSTPEYGFTITDGDGNMVAEIAPGMWPFVKKIIEEAAPFHSPACEEDCRTDIGALEFRQGE